MGALPTIDEVLGASPADQPSDAPPSPAKGSPPLAPLAATRGVAVPGNVELWNRPAYLHPDFEQTGNYGTTESFSREENGMEVLVPQIVNGERLTQQAAWDHYKKTGEHLGKFRDADSADAYAEQLHEAQDRHIMANGGPKAFSRGKLPTIDDVLGPDPNTPSWTSTSDKAIQDFVRHTVPAFGYRIFHGVPAGFGTAATEAFGSQPLTTPDTALSPETAKALKDLGIFNDYTKGQNSFIRTLNEATARQIAAAADLVARVGAAGIAGPLGAIGAAGEITGAGKAFGINLTGEEGLAGAATDLGLMMLAGPLGEVEAANAARLRNLKTTVSRARASGAIGEGEAGFYNVAPLTPENAAARAEAAKEAGIVPPPPPPPPPKTVHELARQIEPEAFKQYDALTVTKDNARADLARIGAERGNLPEARAAQDEISAILGKVHGVEERLTKAQAARLADAQERLDRALRSDSGEMAQARQSLLGADIAQRDLVPTVAAAYRQARELMPGPVTAAEKMTAGAPPKEGVAAKPATAEGATPKPATESGEAEMAQPGPLLSEYEAERKAAGLPEPPEAPEITRSEPNAVEAAAVEPKITAATAQKSPRYSGLRPVAGTGETVVRGYAAAVETKAVEDGLATTLGDLPEYRRVNFADQAAKAVEFLDTDYEAAKKVALGQAAPPKNLLAVAVANAVERRALESNDLATISDLATRSKLSAQITTMGQNIGLLRERDEASPVASIQGVQAARAREVPEFEAQKEAAIKEMSAATTRAAPPRQLWDEFVSSIQCKE